MGCRSPSEAVGHCTLRAGRKPPRHRHRSARHHENGFRASPASARTCRVIGWKGPDRACRRPSAGMRRLAQRRGELRGGGRCGSPRSLRWPKAFPRKLYGGTERVVAWLVGELVELGHEVTLFASGDSRTRGELHAVWPHALRLGRPPIDPGTMPTVNGSAQGKMGSPPKAGTRQAMRRSSRR